MTDRDLLTGLADDLLGLLDLRLVDDRELALALAIRAGRRFEGLRGVQLDHRLFLYLPLALAQRERAVPLALAQRERAVPLTLAGDALTVAAASLDPDLSWVRERFPSLRIELVVSPRNEILTALDRVGV
jgi:type II secretion system (T2SS) protein E